jgi:hypothetical protein
MDTLKPTLKKGQIVFRQGHGIVTFKVLEVSTNGQLADIQAFSLPDQKLLGDVLHHVPASTLTLFTET